MPVLSRPVFAGKGGGWPAAQRLATVRSETPTARRPAGSQCSSLKHEEKEPTYRNNIQFLGATIGTVVIRPVSAAKQAEA